MKRSWWFLGFLTGLLFLAWFILRSHAGGDDSATTEPPQASTGRMDPAAPISSFTFPGAVVPAAAPAGDPQEGARVRLAPEGSLLGEIRSAGEPVSVNGTLTLAASRLGVAASPPQVEVVGGGFSLGAPWSGAILASLPPPDAFLLHPAGGEPVFPASLTLESTAAGLRLIVDLGPPAILDVEVLDLAGNPVAEADTYLGYRSVLDGHQRATARRTDAYGRARIHTWSSMGGARVRARKAGYGPGSEFVSLVGGKQTVTIRLGRILATGVACESSALMGVGGRVPEGVLTYPPVAYYRDWLQRAEERSGLDARHFQVHWAVYQERDMWVADPMNLMTILFAGSDSLLDIAVPLQQVTDPALAPVPIQVPSSCEPSAVVTLRLLPEDRFLTAPPQELLMAFKPVEAGSADSEAGARQGRALEWLRRGKNVAATLYQFVVPAGQYELVSPADGFLAGGASPKLAGPVRVSATAETGNEPLPVQLAPDAWCVETCFVDEFHEPVELEMGLFGVAAGNLVMPNAHPAGSTRFLTAGSRYRVWAAQAIGPLSVLRDDLVPRDPIPESPWIIEVPLVRGLDSLRRFQ